MHRFCLFAAMLFAITSVGASTASEEARFANLVELQPVTIRVELATPRDAQLAKIRPLPLYNGAEWAVTSRWDDNHWGHIPQHGFSVLSPIPRAAIDLKTQSAEQLLKKHWPGPGGQQAEFKPVDPEIAKRLNVERIPVHRGRGVHLLRSRVHSPTKRQVRLVRNTSKVPAVWLNGQPVEASASCSLQAGANDLLLAFVVGYSAKYEGPMFRISDAQTGQRLDDIRYQPGD